MRGLSQKAVIKSGEGKPINVCWTSFHSIWFLTPTAAPGRQLCNLSSGSTTKIRIELQSSSSPSVSQPLDLHSLLLCNLEKNMLTSLCPPLPPPLLWSVNALHSFPEAHLYSISLMPAGPLYQWAMVTVSLFPSNLSLCPSLLVCNKTLGPAVALIELWDHISAALEELDRLSMALCCRPGSH